MSKRRAYPHFNIFELVDREELIKLSGGGAVPLDFDDKSPLASTLVSEVFLPEEDVEKTKMGGFAIPDHLLDPSDEKTIAVMKKSPEALREDLDSVTHADVRHIIQSLQSSKDDDDEAGWLGPTVNAIQIPSVVKAVAPVLLPAWNVVHGLSSSGVLPDQRYLAEHLLSAYAATEQNAHESALMSVCKVYHKVGVLGGWPAGFKALAEEIVARLADRMR